MVINFKWPWAMLPLASADVWIEHIQAGLDTDNPLYGKKLFPSGYREDKKIILIENDDDGTYAVLTYKSNNSTKFSVEVIAETQQVIDLINRDHEKAVAAFDDDS